MAAIATTASDAVAWPVGLENAAAPVHAIQSLRQPVFASECLDAIDLTKIARHHGQPATTSVTCDQ
jgi:hypothetical protein